MFSCVYRKDLNHNYLIITEEAELDSSYEKNMFLKNEFKGLLPCHTRMMNGQMQYYYEISSKQTFESAFSVRDIHFLDLKNLFYMIKMVIDELQKFLLDHTKILFNPKYIYMELETNQMFFFYYPCQTIEINKNIGELVDYLLEKVDHKDNRAADFAYWLYDYSKKEEVSISTIIDYLDQQEEPLVEDIYVDGPKNIKIVECREEIEFKNTEHKNIAWVFIKYIGLPILFEVFLTKCFFQFFIVSPKEVLLLFGGYAVVIATGMILAYKKVKERPNSKEKVKETETETETEKVVIKEITSIDEDDCYGVTTFFGTSQMEHQKILIGKMKGKEIQVSIADMPFVIGKMRDSVNFTLQDMSVSRMHVKFFQKEDLNKIFMIDLNSTNGTYKNGLQLEANEEVEIMPEDEIQIGKLKFTYH